MTPLRRMLARHLLGIQLPLLAILLGLVWWGTRSLLLDLAHRDGEARLKIAVQALDRRLSTVEEAGRFVSTYWEQGRLPFADTTASATLLMPWLFHQNEIPILNLLDEQGRSLLLLRDPDTWRAREIRLGSRGQLQSRWQNTDAAGLTPPENPFRDSVGYDARSRGWYREARLLQAPRWSTPYRLGGPGYRLVLTWLVPLRDRTGRLAGALGLDLPAQDIQAFLEILRPTPGSRLWVLDQDTVLASARGPQVDAPVPSAVNRAVLNGLPHRILRSDIPSHPGTQWRMVLAIPEQDLLATAQTRLLGLTAVACVLLTLLLLWGLWVGRWLSEDIQGLAKAADRLGAGEVPDLPFHEVSEFHSLGQALRRAHAEIQDRIHLQQRLQHSQRMETLGTLAGGIAHDVNNHLGAILGQLFLAREGMPEGHASSQRLTQAEEAAHRCARITKSLLTFSRQGKPDLKPLDLSDLVARTAELLDRVLGGLVHVSLDLDPALPPILGEGLQLEQVVMNMAVNARDAMPEGGTLTFRTRLDREGGVELRVSDTGAGIPAEAVPHIFEPFFTTKPVGQGTGLGLSMVFGIVESHGGTIAVESRLGAGTTFTLVFPAARHLAPEPEAPPLHLAPKGPLAGLRILVAEDEAYLRETLEEALAMACAQVVGASTGEVAWQRFQAQPFDCVLSDQRMPGCTGLELLRRIRASGSPVPFILASGQDLEAFRAELDGDPQVRLLPKPFSMASLVALVGEFGQGKS
jgi:signal transduction histidine kinase